MWAHWNFFIFLHLIFITLLTQHSIRRTFLHLFLCDWLRSLHFFTVRNSSNLILFLLCLRISTDTRNVDDDDDAKNTFQLWYPYKQHLEDIQPHIWCLMSLEDDSKKKWTKNLVWSKFEFPLYDWVRTRECNSDFFCLGFSISSGFNSIVVDRLNWWCLLHFKIYLLLLSYYLVVWGFFSSSFDGFLCGLEVLEVLMVFWAYLGLVVCWFQG